MIINKKKISRFDYNLLPKNQNGERYFADVWTKISDHASVYDDVWLGNGVELERGVIVLSGATLLGGNIVGEGARIDENVVVGLNTRVGSSTRLRENVQTKSGCRIGNRTSVGKNTKLLHRTHIPDDVSIGMGQVVKYIPIIRAPFLIHPHQRGIIRCGCFIGEYDEILSRTQTDWRAKNYNSDQEFMTIAFIEFCRDNDFMFWGRKEEDGKEK